MSEYGLFYDTETNGFNRSGDCLEDQPHIVQIAAILVDMKTRKTINYMSVIVSATDWKIPKATTDIHGIDRLKSLALGVNEVDALKLFLQIWNGHRRFSYNNKFDDQIITHAINRYYSRVMLARWQDAESVCVMAAAKDALGLSKNPKLRDAHEELMCFKFEDEHDAMSDTMACMSVYFATLDRRLVGNMG